MDGLYSYCFKFFTFAKVIYFRETMRTIRLSIPYEIYDSLDELPENDARWIKTAKENLSSAYAPYSRFRVSAVAVTDKEHIVLGVNQENTAYPSGLCAERVALFSAGAGYPGEAVKILAIVAKDEQGNWADPFPCGACRQVMIETEKRSGNPLRILVHTRQEKVFVFYSASDMLPFSFDFV